MAFESALNIGITGAPTVTKGETMASPPSPTICKICDEHCGLLVSDAHGRISIHGNPDHPISRGFICVKARNFGAVHRSPDRLRMPQLKTESGWQEISFEDALDILASRLIACKERFGPESVVFFKGEGLKHFEVAQYMRHLSNGFGSPNYMSIGSLCHYAQVLGHSLTYGGKPVPDFEKIGAVILWGTNPAVSSPRTFGELRKAVRRGVKLIVVDPSLTESARLAHMHLRPRPGSDGFLALAFLKKAIEERHLKLEDHAAEGWSDLVDLVGGVSYSMLLEKTDIAKAQLSEAAALLFGNLPGWTAVGLGLEHRPGGVQTIRAAACLQSLLDPGNKPSHMSVPLKPLPGADRYPPMIAPLGSDWTPLFTNGRREGQGMLLPKAILDRDPYPVRAMLIAGANPMVTFPGHFRQRDSLQSLDFLAVFDLFMTPTARLAHLVIPGADQLDNLELHDYGRIGRPYVGLIRPATSSPLGWPTWKLIFELARKFGLHDLFPWDNNRDAIEYRLAGANIRLSDLEGSPSATAPYPVEPQEKDRRHTEDGKVHYRSNELLSVGQPGITVPAALELPEQTDEVFPFWLSTGDRVPIYHHGQFRGIPEYEKMLPEPVVEIHPDAARQMGAQDGEFVVLSTRFGTLQVRAHLSPEVRRDCLRLTHGWETANANALTGLEHFDPVSGFPWLKALPSKLERKTASVEKAR